MIDVDPKFDSVSHFNVQLFQTWGIKLTPAIQQFVPRRCWPWWVSFPPMAINCHVLNAGTAMAWYLHIMYM